MTAEADFSGYATRNNLRCSDGRTILADAFVEQDGDTVPLVWQHGHDDVKNVLGHARLENVADGVKAHAYFNNTEAGQHAKKMVQNKDVKFLSIFANQLLERSKQVMKGKIREVSLVLAGANPGAMIENVTVAHSDGFVETYDEDAIITTGIEVEVGSSVAHADDNSDSLEHADTAVEDSEETLADVIKTFTPKQMTAFNYVVSQALTAESDLQHSDDEGEELGEGADADEDGADVSSEEDGADEATDSEEEEGTDGSDSDDEGEESESDADGNSEEEDSEETDSAAGDTDSEAGDDAVQHDNINQEEDSMKHNVFDQSNNGAVQHERQTLSHSEVKGIMGDVVRNNTTLSSVLEGYALKHGIENIEYLFPDPKLLESSPNWLSRRVEWVQKVLDGVNKTPFARIRTITADITPDEARARGYIKGDEKIEEVFKLLKRDTTPQTIYKKQKLDRDDVIDITDLDVIAWMKAEMKLMLDEEIAAAILVGDGRSNGDDSKIKEDKVRPIASDDELYAPTFNVNLDDASSSIEELVDKVIEARQYYRGTGNPSFYTSEAVVAKFLQVKDNFGHRLYKTLDEVATVLRVKEVVPVDVFTRQPNVVGILVNLADYSIGTDRGGQATMFDDFDLDFNKLIYLLETRLSGALTLPKSALVFRKVAGGAALVSPDAPAFVSNVVTVPTKTGVTYKNKDTNATLSTGSPVTLAEGEELNVLAIPASGSYYFGDNVNDEWHYEYQD